MPQFPHRRLVGKNVFTQDGTDIGEVVGLDIDTDSWTVLAVEVKLERKLLERLNMDKPMFGAPSVKLAVDRISGVSETVVLKAPLVDLRFIEGE